MNSALLYLIFVPIMVGLLLLVTRRGGGLFALLISALNLIVSIFVFFSGDMRLMLKVEEASMVFILRSYNLSSFILASAAFFTLCVVVYSLGFMGKRADLNGYYGNILLTLGAASGVVLSGDIISLLVFWGFSAFTLYNLVNYGGPSAAAPAKKTFTIVGGSDALMILGAGFVYYLTKTFDLSAMSIPLDGAMPILAYLCLAIPAFAKLGAMPLHAWIPDCSEVAPVSVMALLPASIDKLLGIYLLARMSLNIFVVPTYSFISLFLLSLGSLTIIFGVFSALLQHDLKKLLAFHAVSQVGYMILGIGTGTFLGIAGALFHMINNAIYKSCLFFCAGSVEKEAGTTDLSNLGGLSRAMPLTFLSTAVAALAISGVPPLNGFASKWMIYQSLVGLSERGGFLWILFLASAMFGSALTLASFMKVLNAVFFGVSRAPAKVEEEAPALMWGPPLVLCAVCVVFGVFAIQVPLKYLIVPAVPAFNFSGAWMSVASSALLLLGLLVGFIIYLVGRLSPVKRSAIFLGGENIQRDRVVLSGVNFYDTINDMGVVKRLMARAQKRGYDLYEGLSRLTFGASDALGRLQSGLLHTYLAWCLLGLAILLFVFFIRW